MPRRRSQDAARAKTGKTDPTAKARKDAIAEIDARLAECEAIRGDGKRVKVVVPADDKPADAKPARKRARKQAGDAPKRVSALDAAAQVLAKAKAPMRAQDLIAAMAERGLWTSPGGKTPHATLYAAMMREINNKGTDSRFRKVDRGQFESTGKGA